MQIVLLFLALVCFVYGGQYLGNFSPFLSSSPSYMFVESKIYDVTETAKLELEIGEYVVAQGDFKHNKIVELVVVSCEGNCFYFLCWNHGKWLWEECEWTQNRYYVGKIKNIVAMDFSYNGWIDLLVETVVDENNKKLNYTLFENQNTEFKVVKDAFRPLSIMMDELTIMDYTGNYRLDLFGMNEAMERGVLIYNSTGGIHWDWHKIDETGLSQIVLPQTSSLVDFDGNCISDLFVTSCELPEPDGSCNYPKFEFWKNKLGKFSKIKEIAAPKGSERVVWADLNKDGNFDMVFYQCWPKEDCSEINEIVIRYSNGDKLCGTSHAGSKCKKASALCNQQSSEISFEEGNLEVRVPLEDYIIPKNSDGVRNIVISDYDLDGYPDLLLVVSNKATNKRVIKFFNNVACSTSSCGDNRDSLRFFQEDNSGLDLIQGIEDPDYIFPFDIDNQGHNDFIVSTYTSETNRSTHLFYNNIYSDTYFVKTYMLNGCSNNDYLNYGTIHPGAIVKFTIADSTGITQAHVGVLNSENHLMVSNPFIIVGTGRTSDYIQNFLYAYPISHEKKQYMDSQEGLIPNTQILCIPEIWKTDLFNVLSFQQVLWVSISVFGTIAILAIPIAFLYLIEIIKDRREKMKRKSLRGVFIG